MTELQQAIIVAYRETVAERYSIDYLRQNTHYDEVSDEDINAMREFFLEHVYPDPANRENLESALHALGGILKSPRKLWLLLGANPFGKLGGMLPSAMRAGLRTFDAFVKIRRLERRLDEEARKQKVGLDQVTDRSTFLKLVRKMPPREIVKFRRDGIALLESLADSQLLVATIDIMDASMKIMDDHKDVFDEQEREGIATGYRLLTGAHALFETLRPEQVATIVKGIELIESGWFEDVLEGKIQ